MVTRNKAGHHIMIKGSLHQKDIIIIRIYAPNTQALKYIKLLITDIYIYIFLAALGLRCYTQTFYSCGEKGLLVIVVCGFLIAVASLCCRARALGAWASVVVACRLSSCD